MFLRFLVARIASRTTPVGERRAAAAYVGGFLVRSRQLRQVTCLNFFKQLNVFAMHYQKMNGVALKRERVSPEDGAPHIVFYGVCQALFYVFTRRHSMFSALLRNSLGMDDLSLDKLVGSNLNPLRYIDPQISKGLTKSLVKLQIADCNKVLEYNAKFPSLDTPKPGVHAGGLTSAQRSLKKILYFPFEKCPLESLDGYLKSLYRTDHELEQELRLDNIQNSPLLSPGPPSVIQSPFTAASSPALSPAVYSINGRHVSGRGPTPSPPSTGCRVHPYGPTPPSSQSLAASSSPFVQARGGIQLPAILLPPAAHEEMQGAGSATNGRTAALRSENGFRAFHPSDGWRSSRPTGRLLDTLDSKLAAPARRIIDRNPSASPPLPSQNQNALYLRSSSFDSDASRVSLSPGFQSATVVHRTRSYSADRDTYRERDRKE
uniref:Uncharacterized protein n=3 Tax=Lotharella globosa TaxID=91324 RepID=A0A7S3YGU1_9EUKA|mmetsp:Transcript_15389/g.31223  ORF Transcript_15389/g.31223 Transcript_15389/m.31223 type:complete len:433 (+) Transcript_15389:139-1437(+)